MKIDFDICSSLSLNLGIIVLYHSRYMITKNQSKFFLQLQVSTCTKEKKNSYVRFVIYWLKCIFPQV